MTTHAAIVTPLPTGADLSDKAATLARWASKGGKWGATLWRNYAGSWNLSETKGGKSIGGFSRPAGYFESDAAALEWFRQVVPTLFDVQMIEQAAQ